MEYFRPLAHLLEQLGDERFQALISSDNTGKVREFCDGLIEAALPTVMTIAGRTYDLFGFLRGGEKSVKGSVMVARSKKMNASLGKEEGEYLLAHQDEIPVALRDKVAFVFTDWRNPDDSEYVAFVYWDGGRWVRCWYWLGDVWRGRDRVLRRK